MTTRAPGQLRRSFGALGRGRGRALLPCLAPVWCLACGGEDPIEHGNTDAVCRAAPPAPSAFTPLSGPGGPTQSFNEAPASAPCAFLDGGEHDTDHHNTGFMLDGYLVMPIVPEWGDGVISVFDFSDACSPKALHHERAMAIRETHATGVSTHAGRHMVVAHLQGLSFWDMSEVTRPARVADLVLPGVFYPDAYARVVMSLFWQAPYVYVAGSDNGLYIVDATDPANPELVTQYRFEVPLRAGGVFAVGSLLVVTAAEGSRVALLDISDPAVPVPIPGGTFEVTDEAGVPRDVYHSHVNGDKLLFARKGGGGGLILYDIKDPSRPTYLGGNSPPQSNGGYVYLKDDRAFVGDSSFASVFNIKDPAQVTLEHTFHLQSVDPPKVSPGDLDTLLPIGNVVIASSDENNRSPEHPSGDLVDRASQVFAMDAAPDTLGPIVTMVNPPDGAVGVARSSRVGITLSEFVDLGSVFAGSFQVMKQGCQGPLPGHYSGQEGILSFWPKEPLEPNTTYEVVVPAGGIIDASGNPTRAAFRASFTTGD